MNKLKFHLKNNLARITILLMTVFVSTAQSAEKKVLIAYFSVPENVALNGVDAATGASVLLKNGNVVGSNQYVAQLIQQQTGGDIYRIEAPFEYPDTHDPLLEFAQKEKRTNTRPAIKTPLPDLEQYDTVYVGYPIWWYQMPMIMYTFFEQNNFSGKTIIPFTVHGGSRFSGSIKVIQNLQPNADVVTTGLAISRNRIDSEQIPSQVSQWLNTFTKQ
ncbi:flavodoxin [Vibrio diazotrophicus]